MSIPHKALKLVQKALPHLRLCKDMLVLPSTEYILRGFSFERARHRGEAYLWRLVLPLYRYHSRRTVEYSERVGCGCVRLSREAPEQTVAEITRLIAEDIPNLERIRTPVDFLGHVGWMIGNDSPHFLLDLAVTYFLVGRIEDAAASLRQVGTRTDELAAYYTGTSGPDSAIVKRLTEVRGVAEDLRTLIEADHSAAAQTIKRWTQKNIVAFELGGAAADTANE